MSVYIVLFLKKKKKKNWSFSVNIFGFQHKTGVNVFFFFWGDNVGFIFVGKQLGIHDTTSFMAR